MYVNHVVSYEWIYVAHLLPHQQLTYLVTERVTTCMKINFVYTTETKKNLIYKTLKVGKFYHNKVKITH